ncbi:hypothetical protein BDZ97DRAFT_1808209 [Flammula alnicola]|nr:hypothetical protein BDZ97DRAFT_1808209 [Flammula alnicola]
MTSFRTSKIAQILKLNLKAAMPDREGKKKLIVSGAKNLYKDLARRYRDRFQPSSHSIPMASEPTNAGPSRLPFQPSSSESIHIAHNTHTEYVQSSAGEVGNLPQVSMFSQARNVHISGGNFNIVGGDYHSIINLQPRNSGHTSVNDYPPFNANPSPSGPSIVKVNSDNVTKAHIENIGNHSLQLHLHAHYSELHYDSKNSASGSSVTHASLPEDSEAPPQIESQITTLPITTLAIDTPSFDENFAGLSLEGRPQKQFSRTLDSRSRGRRSVDREVKKAFKTLVNLLEHDTSEDESTHEEDLDKEENSGSEYYSAWDGETAIENKDKQREKYDANSSLGLEAWVTGGSSPVNDSLNDFIRAITALHMSGGSDQDPNTVNSSPNTNNARGTNGSGIASSSMLSSPQHESSIPHPENFAQDPFNMFPDIPKLVKDAVAEALKVQLEHIQQFYANASCIPAGGVSALSSGANSTSASTAMDTVPSSGELHENHAHESRISHSSSSHGTTNRVRVTRTRVSAGYSRHVSGLSLKAAASTSARRTYPRLLMPSDGYEADSDDDSPEDGN